MPLPPLEGLGEPETRSCHATDGCAAVRTILGVIYLTPYK